ncbi:SpoIID/LytB domain-containing protein [Prevotella cerevisiae]|uniref:SpoIID/LytB domain-containing protein n=1 Tax=Segatella cerevisiae TaxID=2053716 RepID=A0ABT1BXK1_9BACT|nr:SpoIID/LytB domain-containing protein [Segatella cerevisiae]MCO6024993.1 SpoIID/LytB domain-containing protein [Segatella cerevisiae]
MDKTFSTLIVTGHHEPDVTVGIVSATRMHFVLNDEYVIDGNAVTGEQDVSCSGGKILWHGEAYGQLAFIPRKQTASFSLDDVMIGVGFHWERTETQVFQGALNFVMNGDKLCAINQLPVEDYLKSVISSEMSATSSLELLKAHAVISRSWLLAQMEKRQLNPQKSSSVEHSETPGELIRWYDRDDHTLFDVCADDHCQRYEGITRETSPNVTEAIRLTRGMILVDDGKICDARFSKCCGGVTEEFQYCWEDTPKSYLTAVRDTADEHSDFPDLTVEVEADKWIRSQPPAFCNTHDPKILGQVLNDYDQETKDFYRWKVEYTQQQLQKLISDKLHMDFGDIKDLQPVQRGRSGRLSKLKIVGTKRTLIIGKELEIRRTLSPSHLYSSAFVVDRLDPDDKGIPARFIILGAGWGHGVGLCQIGAAVMGEKGYPYDQILLHYYRDAELLKVYS